MGVDLEPTDFLDLLLLKHLAGGGVKRPCAECGVKKANTLARRKQGECVRQDVQCKQRWCGELAEAIPIRLRFLGIEVPLQGDAPLLYRVDGIIHNYTPNRDRSSIRCSHTQSIPSAASYPR
jgi:hypothetical protein